MTETLTKGKPFRAYQVIADKKNISMQKLEDLLTTLYNTTCGQDDENFEILFPVVSYIDLYAPVGKEVIEITNICLIDWDSTGMSVLIVYKNSSKTFVWDREG